MKPVEEKKGKGLKSHEFTMLKHNDVTKESESDMTRLQRRQRQNYVAEATDQVCN